MSTTKAIGDFGEEQACEHLKNCGYGILDRQFRSRFGEVDIIAKKDDIVAMVEVKLRRNGKPGDAVTYKKQQKLKTTALWWLGKQGREYNIRFDVIEIYAPYGIDGRLEIVHIENAFC